MANESVERARYRLKVARQNIRHSQANTQAYRAELQNAKLALKDAKIQVREHKRRGRGVVAHERRRARGFFETREHYERRLRAEKAEEAPLT